MPILLLVLLCMRVRLHVRLFDVIVCVAYDAAADVGATGGIW